MWAMIVKEFRQIRRDRRTLAMMILMPVVLLVVLGYAASFNVSSIPVAAAGPQAAAVARLLPAPFRVVAAQPAQGRTWAAGELRDGHAAVAVVTGSGRPDLLIDGTQLFTAQATLAALARLAASGHGPLTALRPQVSILYNPKLTTSFIMIPGLAGVVLVFVGTIITSLGVVRERQSGTLEQLAVMPLRPRDVFLGKIVPYFVIAAVDMGIVLAVGIAIFGVPFRGSPAVFALGALLFVFVTLSIGVLISSVSQTQGQAIQLAVMTLLPQMLLSGLIFPLASIAAGVRWIAYLLPLTYFNEISRGVMLRAEPITALWLPLACLTLLGLVAGTVATLRFRAFLAPAARHLAAAPLPAAAASRDAGPATMTGAAVVPAGPDGGAPSAPAAGPGTAPAPAAALGGTAPEGRREA